MTLLVQLAAASTAGAVAFIQFAHQPRITNFAPFELKQALERATFVRASAVACPHNQKGLQSHQVRIDTH